MQPKLFNSSFNDRAEEFKKYLPVNINLRFETIASHIALCEENYIRPLLGSALFERLASYYADHPTLPTDDADKQLIEKVRFALIRLAIWKGYDIISANISDVGVSAEVNKENRLYRYQEENIKRTLKEEGFNYLDNILLYIEEHDTDYPEFDSSGHALSSTQSLIRNTKMFDECYQIGGSRLVFLKMQQYIRDVELIELQHRLGSDFYKVLLTADENELRYSSIMPAIRLFVVYYAVAEGIGELHKLPTEKGLLFETTSMEDVQVSPVYQNQIMETRARCIERANQHLAFVIYFLKNHPSDFPEYTSFAGDSPEDGVMHFDNTNKKIFLA
ncbi:MAG: hypothetical protein J5644_03805 [Bacteroidales bacterium]|nr:hypothetical protein [Bacteroidales bacterium]